MAFENIYTFDNPDNFNFDSEKIEITDKDKCRLRDINQSSFIVEYETDADPDADYSKGDPTGNLFGGATVSDGKLNLISGVDQKYCQYSAILNADSQQKGAFRIGYVPNYAGYPLANQEILIVVDSVSKSKNEIKIRHRPSGDLELNVKNYLGNVIMINESFGLFSAVQGREYEIELNYDFDVGETRMFIDGILFGTRKYQTGVRNDEISLINLGSDPDGPNKSDFWISYFLAFEKVQHITNYTPSPYAQSFNTDNPSVSPKSALSVSGILSFLDTIIESGNDKIRHVITVNGSDKWYNTESELWEDSTGYEESNTANEIKNNAEKLDLTDGFFIYPKTFLHSEDGNSTPQIDDISINYNYNPTGTDVPRINIFGYLKDPDGQPQQNGYVLIYPDNYSEYGNNQIPIETEKAEANEEGGWSKNLIPSEDISDTPYNFVFINGDNTKVYKKKFVNPSFPGQNQIEYKDLVDAE